MSTFTRLLRLAAPFRWWMALSALLGFATIASSIGLMSTSAWIIATAALHPSIAVLQVAITGVRFFGLARGVFRYLERYVSHQVTFRLLARLRVWFYEGLEPLAPARLMDYRSGDLLARVVADIETLENFYLRVLAPPAIALLTAILMGAFFSFYDTRLAIGLLLFLALAGIGVPLLTRRLSGPTARHLITLRSDLNTALVDGIQGMADLIASGAQHRQAARITALSRAVTRAQARMAWTGGLNTALGSLLTGLAVLAVLVLAIPLVRDGQIEGVMLAVLALATMASFEAVLPLPQAFQHLSANLEAAQRLFEILDASAPLARLETEQESGTASRPSTRPSPPLQAVEREPGGEANLSPLLTVSDLHFRYAPDAPPALDGISFTLHQGHTLAIVGASGAGKSSLVKVLLRFWDYQHGTIQLAGRDLRDYEADEARALLGVVSQNTTLFNSTIRDNLRIARPDATDDDLIRAAQQAQLHDFILSLSQGYDTWIGEQGLKLSGGERQRLAIARAILKDAPLLVLDEATANLDPVTERDVMQAIHAAMHNRTTLMITHRITGLDAADEILVMRRGRIVERGTHADLMQMGGYYRRLWELQHSDIF